MEKKKGVVSVIKYEGPNDVFAWKHPIEDFNSGSQLIVHESQEAIFFKDGQALDLFGAGRYTLETQNIPLLRKSFKIPSNESGIFHSEIYYVNLTTQMGIKWGTDSKVRMFDPASGMHIELGACGTFNLRVVNSRKFLVKVVGTTDGYKQGNFLEVSSAFSTGSFRSLVMNRVKSNLARMIRENNINILAVDEHLETLSLVMRDSINETLDDYGMFMPEFFITTIMTPDDDPNFRRLKQQFADKTLRVREEQLKQAEAEAAQQRKIVEAQTAAQLKLVGAQGEAEALRIKAQAEADAYKAKALAEAEEMRAKGYTYQQETARQVGMEAMQNGITGGSGGGGGNLGDIAGLGVTLGAMGGVINMTKEAMSPIMGKSVEMGAGFGGMVNGQGNAVSDMAGTWMCVACGASNLTSRFCPDCGTPRPVPENVEWTCTNCGTAGIKSKFCPNCGSKRS